VPGVDENHFHLLLRTEKRDERILGDGDFVEAVLAHATETLNRKHNLWTKDINLETIIQQVGELLDMTREEVLFAGKNPRSVHARSLLCYLGGRSVGSQHDRAFHPA